MSDEVRAVLNEIAKSLESTGNSWEIVVSGDGRGNISYKKTHFVKIKPAK